MVEWATNRAWQEYSNTHEIRNAKIKRDAFLEKQKALMLDTAFKVKEDIGAIKNGSIVRGTWLGRDFDDKQLRVEVLPPVGSKAPITFILIPFDNIEELKDKVEFGRENIIKPTILEKEKEISPSKSADIKLTTKQKIIYGAVIGFAIYGGLKMFKLV